MIRHHGDIKTADAECYHGLRMTAEEYFALGETQEVYELIDGVVCSKEEAEYIPDGEEVYVGLRMTADEFAGIGETYLRYELIDGVVCMSPSPNIVHQRLVTQLTTALTVFAAPRQLGEVLVEMDVCMGTNPHGGDLVYRPDLIFLGADKVVRAGRRVTVPPDVIVEILSFRSRQMDRVTKRSDYERFGVREYWLIDPEEEAMDFLTLHQGSYKPMKVENTRLRSEAVPGFELDLAQVRKLFTTS